MWIDHSQTTADRYSLEDVLAGKLDAEVNNLFGGNALAELRAACRRAVGESRSHRWKRNRRPCSAAGGKDDGGGKPPRTTMLPPMSLPTMAWITAAILAVYLGGIAYAIFGPRKQHATPRRHGRRLPDVRGHPGRGGRAAQR